MGNRVRLTDMALSVTRRIRKENGKLLIYYNDLLSTFERILVREGFKPADAQLCAKVFADNTLDGVHSHGVGRFERVVLQMRKGDIRIGAEPVRVKSLGGLEIWDGCHGVGILNALAMIDRAMELAQENGVGLAAIRNTNHWMRGATYGYRAAERGFPCICWTNTLSNMSPWGTTTRALGNNPIVFAMPGKEHHVVLDMALSQYSYGKLETMRLLGEQLPYAGGFDSEGNLTTDPAAIYKSKQILPIGLWKGSGLAILLDLFASVLSEGTSTAMMPDEGPNVSQVFIAIHPGLTEEQQAERREHLERVLLKLQAQCEANHDSFSYPGLGTRKRRMEALKNGIPVDDGTWRGILSL